MKKHAKILVPLGALALSMGTFAIAKPVMADDLIPMDYNTNHNTSADVTVKVVVVGEVPEVMIDSPLDGSKVHGKKAEVKINYAKASQLDYTLIHIGEGGVETVYNLPSKIVAETGTADGIDEFELDLDTFGGDYGKYIFKVAANGAGSTEDSIMFEFAPAEIKEKGKDDEGNPIIVAPDVSEAVSVDIQVYDEDGNPILDPSIVKDLNGEDIEITIPFSKYDLPEGDYRIVANYYDRDGNLVMTIVKIVHYKPAEAPEVPDTGGFIGALGLSKQDIASTGLALLFIAAFFGVLIIAKKSKSSKRR